MQIVGELDSWHRPRRKGGLLKEISILMFLAILDFTLRSQSRQKARGRS